MASAAATLASLPLTVALLVLSILLVFAATLDQVHLGVWGVQAKYFHAFFVDARVPGTEILVPVFPGGYLLGGALLANLIAAHFSRFRFSWRKSGIWLTHFGLILLIAGEGISGLMQRDDQMRLDLGQTRRYAESVRDYELALVDTSGPRSDIVVSIPASLLRSTAEIQAPRLPFVVRPVAYFPNAMLRPRELTADAVASVATQGDGTSVLAQPVPAASREGDTNWPTAYVELRGPEGSLGVWLVSAMLRDAQAFDYAGRHWELSLRPRRDYLPYALTLLRFTHDVYPGTDIPKNFASTLRVQSDDGRTDRKVVIYMNNPLRFEGRAFYQAGYDNNDRTTVLQVVRNPGWKIPYVACALMAAGLLLQFGLQLTAFSRRRTIPAPEESPRALLPRPVPFHR